MLVIPITFNLDKQQSAYPLTEIIASHDIQSIKFELSFNGIDLTGKTVKVLSKYESSGSQTLLDCLIVEGKAILIPDTSLISGDGYVHNYIYVYEGASSLDVQEFLYETKLSEIDRSSVVIKKVYDKSYNNLLLDFEQALNEYKLTIPELSAEIDVVMNRFGMESRAKLNQFDADAQQVIEDNQTAFGLAESGRQVAEATRKSNENDRTSSETTRKTNETTRVSNEDERKSAEVIRLASEVDRVNSENARAGFYEGFDGRLDDLEADKVVIKNLVTNGDFSKGFDGWSGVQGFIIETTTFGYPTAYANLVSQVSSFYQDIQASTTDKLYIKSSYYISEHTAGALRLTVRDFGTMSNATLLPLDLAKKNQWQAVSGVISKLNGIRLAENGVTSTAKYHISKVMAINLTQTFGAGNEPTKAEMDELIKITGYFDEITLTQKQLLNWQLKLMRQNRNALIALGGTII